MKKILLSVMLMVLLIPNVYKAAITDSYSGTTNSKTTIENKYTDKIVNIELDLSNKKEYEFTESDSNGKNLLMVLKYDKKSNSESFYNEEGKEVTEENAVFKIEPTESGYKALSINDDEIITTSKKTKVYNTSVKTGSKTYFTGVTIGSDGKATYDYRQEDYYTRTNYYLNLTYGQDVITYKILEGGNSTYNDEDLVIKISAAFEKFDSIKVNDVVIEKEKYDVTSGSTIVTLKNDYLKTLSAGEYEVTFLFTDGSASTKFKVNQKEEVKTSSKINSKTIIYIGGTLAIIGIVIGIIVLLKRKNK